jgi:hypothetical protein
VSLVQIVLEPGVMELGANRDAYDTLVEDLAAQGFEARLHQKTERRDGGVQHAAADLVIFLAGAAGASVIDSIVKAVIAHVRESVLNKRHPHRRGVIFGPNGDVLHEFDITEPDD